MALTDTANLKHQGIQAIQGNVTPATTPVPPQAGACDRILDEIFGPAAGPADCRQCGCPDFWKDAYGSLHCVACEPAPARFPNLIRGVLRVYGSRTPYVLKPLDADKSAMSLAGVRATVEHDDCLGRWLCGPDLTGTGYEHTLTPDGIPWWLFGDELDAWKREHPLGDPVGRRATYWDSCICRHCGSSDRVRHGTGLCCGFTCGGCGKTWWPVPPGDFSPAAPTVSSPIDEAYGSF